MGQEDMPDETTAPVVPTTRFRVIGGSVNEAEKALIEQARERTGRYKNMSECVRDVMLAWATEVMKPKRKQDIAA